MKRMLQFLAVFAAILLTALIVALVFARIYFTDERILALLRPRLEQRFNRAITIDGAQLSFWKGLGVRLEGVTVGNGPGFGRPHLLQLDELDAKVRFWPLVAGKIALDRVLVGPGELRLEINELGRNNWTGLVKGDTTRVPRTATDSAMAAVPRIPIAGKMEFAGITVSLDDHQRVRMFELSDISGRSEVTVSAADSSVSATGSFLIGGGEILSKARSWKPGPARLELDFDLSLSFPARRLDLRNVVVRAFGTPATITGTVENLGGAATYALNVRIEPLGLAEVFAQLPDSLWRPVFPGGPPEGSVQADIAVTSPPVGQRLPNLDGKILASEVRGRLGEKAIPFQAAGVNVRLAKTVISLTTQSLTVAELPVMASLTIDQPQAPNFSGGVSGEFDIAPLAGILRPGMAVDAGGRVELAITGFGPARNWRSLNVNGRIDFTNLRWRTPDTTAVNIDDLSGRLKFAGTGAQVEKLSVRSGASTLEITGRVERLIPYLAHFGKHVEKPHLQFELYAPFADLDRLLPGEDTSTVPPLPIIDLVADGTIRLDSAVYFRVPFADFSCGAHFADVALTLSDLRGRAYSGSVTGKATVDFTDWVSPAFVMDTKAEDIEANEFIERFTGFGGHLFGKIKLAGKFAAQGGEIPEILQTLTAQGEVSMTEGRFEKLDLLSTLAGQARLSGIHNSGPIKDMVTDFWVEEGRLFCRDWSFASSGTRYNLAGSVGFDGSLDYRIKIDLPRSSGDRGVLSALGDMFSGSSGGISLNLALTGTYTQPVIRLDSRENRQDFERNLKAKARELLQNLRQR